MNRGRFAIALLLLLTPSCSPTQFYVYVQDARHRTLAEADVELHDPKYDPCASGPTAAGGILPEGYALMQARWCGPSRLLVAAWGYTPVSMIIDSCHAGELFVELKPRPPEPAGDDMVVTARTFLALLQQRDLVALQELLFEPSEIGLFEGPVALRNRGKTCRPRFVRALAGTDPRVEFAFDCENGCYGLWHVHMAQAGGHWRVRTLTPQTPYYLMP